MKILLLVAIVVLILWSAWGYFSSNVEQAQYTVLEQADGYEIREYPAHIVAQTTVTGTYDEALNEGFRIIAAYIFGENVPNQKIAMTAPVTEQGAQIEKVAMTAPVMAEIGGTSRTISFVVPQKYTLSSLPQPTNSHIEILEVPEKRVAALRFSWFQNANRVQDMQEKLLALLARDEREIVGTPVYAGYNAPWTPPWMTRHEILVELQ